MYSYRVKGKRKGVTLGQYETALEGALAYARHRLKEAAYTEQVASPSLQEQSASPPRATQSRDEPAASGDGPKRRRSLQASAKPSVADSAKPSVADSPKAKEAGSAPKGGRSSVRTGSQVSKTISKTSRARTARAKGGGPKGGVPRGGVPRGGNRRVQGDQLVARPPCGTRKSSSTRMMSTRDLRDLRDLLSTCPRICRFRREVERGSLYIHFVHMRNDRLTPRLGPCTICSTTLARAR